MEGPESLRAPPGPGDTTDLLLNRREDFLQICLEDHAAHHNFVLQSRTSDGNKSPQAQGQLLARYVLSAMSFGAGSMRAAAPRATRFGAQRRAECHRGIVWAHVVTRIWWTLSVWKMRSNSQTFSKTCEITSPAESSPRVLRTVFAARLEQLLLIVAGPAESSPRVLHTVFAARLEQLLLIVAGPAESSPRVLHTGGGNKPTVDRLRPGRSKSVSSGARARRAGGDNRRQALSSEHKKTCGWRQSPISSAVHTRNDGHRTECLSRRHGGRKRGTEGRMRIHTWSRLSTNTWTKSKMPSSDSDPSTTKMKYSVA
jgi:hypothetical protein